MSSHTINQFFNKIFQNGNATVNFELSGQMINVYANKKVKMYVVDEELRIESEPNQNSNFSGANFSGCTFNGGIVAGGDIINVNNFDGVSFTQYINTPKNQFSSNLSKLDDSKLEYDQYSHNWTICTAVKVLKVELNGNGQLNFNVDFWTKCAYLQINQAGRIHLFNGQFDLLNVHIKSNGILNLAGSTIDSANFDLYGSGHILGFKINKIGLLNVIGSGQIIGRSNVDCQLSKSIKGSGKIEISK
jgi:uncharacterized protein YjbI with pentapeptide repeats